MTYTWSNFWNNFLEKFLKYAALGDLGAGGANWSLIQEHRHASCGTPECCGTCDFEEEEV